MSRFGTIVWNELMTSNLEAAKAHYAAVLGWSYQEQAHAEGAYTLAFAPGGDQPIAGLFPWPKEMPGADSWGAYVAVADCDATAAAVTAAGGTICRAPWDIAGVGRVAIVADPMGAVIGLLQPASGPGC